MTTDYLDMIGARSVHAPPFNELGDKVIVAIIDDGIDVMHSAFRDATGGTRILQVWDQTANVNEAMDQIPFGQLFLKPEIDEFIRNGSAPSQLSAAHGTRVASIAAGRAAPPTASGDKLFQGGVAPEAKIVIVKTEVKVGSALAHINAINFAERVASEHNLPMVINLSFGESSGAHDGSTMLEAFIDQYTMYGRRPGRVIVKSAGNEGNKNSHAFFQLGKNSVKSLIWNSRSVNREQDLIELWFNASDTFKLQLHQPGNTVSGGVSDEVSISNPFIEGELQNGNEFQISYERFERSNGDSLVTIIIQPGRAEGIEGGDWKLKIKADSSLPSGGGIHAWLERNDTRPIKFKESNRDTTVTIPGTSYSVITVAAAIVGLNDNQVIEYELWPGSSRGPTRDGRQKPDLSAPGKNVPGARFRTEHDFITDSGTSYAAPHVSGAIALLLSHRYKQIDSPQDNYNAEQIRSFLTQFSPTYNGEWSNNTGFGLLDVHAIFKALAQT